MADIHLITAIAKRYAKLAFNERVKKVRKLVARSRSNEVFIRKYFPDLYEEAFPTSSSISGDAAMESDQRPPLYARPR